jgi:hypothetical protein
MTTVVTLIAALVGVLAVAALGLLGLEAAWQWADRTGTEALRAGAEALDDDDSPDDLMAVADAAGVTR